MPVYWGIFGGSNFHGFHGYYVIRPMKNCVQYRMGMIACAREHYTVNLITLKFFTIIYICPMACMQYKRKKLRIQ